ncbi:MAG: hypothetical protein ACK40G_17265 [Cytophagaceae bacterium]
MKNNAVQNLENAKAYLIYGTMTAGLAAGLFFGGRYVIRTMRQNSVTKDTLNYGSAASYAARLKMAFENDNYFGWGTDEEVIFQVFREIKTQKEYEAIQVAYAALNPGRQLNADLKEELSSADFMKVMNYLSMKPLK